jgi:hypothetical protein
MGPYTDCISPASLLAAFNLGASRSEADHFKNCPACMQRVETYTRQPQRHLTIEALGSKSLLRRLQRFIGKPETENFTSLLLCNPEEEMKISPDTMVVPVSLEVLAPACFVQEANLWSLRISGAISGSAIIDRDGMVGCDAGRLAKHLRQDLRHHYRVTDNIRLTGIYCGSNRLPFSGNASITFSRM